MTTDTPHPDDETQPVARRGLRERVRSLRRPEGGGRGHGLAALVAAALAGVIVGGLGVTAVHAITHDGPGERFDREGLVQRHDDRRGPGFDDRGGMHGPAGVPGQVPPTTPPEDEGSAS